MFHTLLLPPLKLHSLPMKCKKISLLALRAGFRLAQVLAKPLKFRDVQRRVGWVCSETWKQVSIIRLLILIAKKKHAFLYDTCCKTGFLILEFHHTWRSLFFSPFCFLLEIPEKVKTEKITWFWILTDNFAADVSPEQHFGSHSEKKKGQKAQQKLRIR